MTKLDIGPTIPTARIARELPTRSCIGRGTAHVFNPHVSQLLARTQLVSFGGFPRLHYDASSYQGSL